MKLSLIRNRFHYCIYFFYIALRKGLLGKLSHLRILTYDQTLDYIIANHISISRLGDGEFFVINGKDGLFQTSQESLRNKLKQVLTSPINKHLIAIPACWKHILPLKYESFEYWSSFLSKNFNEKVYPYLIERYTYADSTFTRFYMDYRTSKIAQQTIPQLKKIWNNRSVCIVEGEYTRFAVNNDLLDNARTVSRIICPAQNAFDRYDEILDAIRSQERYDVYLIALGMTATCLAYDLAKEGYWAIDIGHADIEYEWFIRKAKSKISIPGKYVSESDNAMMTSNIDLHQYNAQILCSITQ